MSKSAVVPSREGLGVYYSGAAGKVLFQERYGPALRCICLVPRQDAAAVGARGEDWDVNKYCAVTTKKGLQILAVLLFYVALPHTFPKAVLFVSWIANLRHCGIAFTN